MRSTPRICNCCGKEYYYCPHCKEDANKPTWMFAWDTLECKEVFNTLSKYNMGDIDKKSAKEKLAHIITHKTKFVEHIQKELDELFKEDVEEKKETLKPQSKSSKKIVTDN